MVTFAIHVMMEDQSEAQGINVKSAKTLIYVILASSIGVINI